MMNIAEIPLTELVDSYVEDRAVGKDTRDLMLTTLKSLHDFALLSNNKALIPNDLNRGLLVRWRKWLLESKKCSPATWNTYRRHLFALLRWIGLQGWTSGVVMQGVKGVSEVNRGKKTIERIPLLEVIHTVEKNEIGGAFPGWFWADAMRFFYFTGMRRRQFAGLRWADIDRKRMTILLRADHSKTKREWTIPLHPPLLAILDNLQEKSNDVMQEQHNRKLRRDDQLWNCSLFNPRYRKASTDVENISQVFRRIREKTGVDISAHKFRHTFATKLAKEGDLKELQHILGHTNLSTTMGYVQADVSRMRKMLGGLGDDI